LSIGNRSPVVFLSVAIWQRKGMRRRTFQENLIRLMDAHDIEGVDLARKIGTSKSTISRYRDGLRQPGGAEIVALARFFGVTAEDLLGTTGIVPRTRKDPISATKQKAAPG